MRSSQPYVQNCPLAPCGLCFSKFLSSEQHLSGLQLRVLPSPGLFVLLSVLLRQSSVVRGPPDSRTPPPSVFTRSAAPVSTMPPSILLFANSQAFLKILLSVFFPPLSMPRAGPAFPFYASHCTVFTCNTLTSGYPVPLEGHSCPINVLSGWHRTGLQQTSACSSPPQTPHLIK